MRTCTIDGCYMTYTARGLCSRHYWRARRAGTLPDTWDRTAIKAASRAHADLIRPLANQARRSVTDHRIEGIDFLVDGGVSVEEAVIRVGWTVTAAVRSLYRRRRYDLARQLNSAAKAAREKVAA